MLSTIRFRAEVIWSTAAVATLAFLLALAGCGGDNGGRASAGRQVSGDEAPTATVTQPQLPLEIKTAWQESEPTQESIAGVPEPPREVTYEEAESAFMEKRYSEAVDLFTLYSERRPENPWGHYMLGLSAWKAGDYDGAELAFERALELDPDHVKSWLNLARVQLDTGRPEEALAKIEGALSIDPGYSVALRLQGRARHQLGQAEEAIDSYRQAILIDDRDAWSMNNMGLILIEQERFVEALPPLARAVELRDGVAIFRNNLGMALERTGHFSSAREAYKSAIAVDGSHQKAYANLGRVESLEDDPTLEPVDFGELAQAFVDEVEGWREAVAYKEAPDFVEFEPIIVSEADSTENKQER